MKPSLFAQLLCACCISLSPLLALAEKPTPEASREVEQLIARLRTSGCEFQRNGSWYDSGKAADHLRQKYDYLLKKGWVVTAEDFIARAGSESSMSHKPYQVRCEGKPAENSAAWLQAELARLRAGGR